MNCKGLPLVITYLPKSKLYQYLFKNIMKTSFGVEKGFTNCTKCRRESVSLSISYTLDRGLNCPRSYLDTAVKQKTKKKLLALGN
jgi:hypothetical protein